jgi:ubiquinone/menaquinone biosynthesis C-methylase UbiE
VEQVRSVLHSLEPVRTLDVGCGTGFLTGELPGAAVGLDLSEQMLAIARRQVPGVEFVRGDATRLPFADGSFGRVFASTLFSHLEPDLRARFLAEAHRVAPDGSSGPGKPRGTHLAIRRDALARLEPERRAVRVETPRARRAVSSALSLTRRPAHRPDLLGAENVPALAPLRARSGNPDLASCEFLAMRGRVPLPL